MSSAAEQPYSAKAFQLVECPRDAMQGWKTFIPTEKKIAYINSLLTVGFHTIDFGSFVSPKAIPQMADTKEVLRGLELTAASSKLLAIVANLRGAEEALAHEEIACLGFPFSLSETFQQRNTNSSMMESLARVGEMQNLCLDSNREMVVYLSMGFGNPYGDEYSEAILLRWADEMVSRGIRILSLADTVGVATPAQIRFALNTLIPKYPDVTFGVHLHATQAERMEKLQAAAEAGCIRFDGALKGIGGCPMAGNALVGNMDTEIIVDYLEEEGFPLRLNQQALAESKRLAAEIFV